MKKLERDALLADLAAVNTILSSLPEGDQLGRISFGARKAEIERALAELENWRERVPAEVVRGALVPPIPIIRGTLILPPLTCGQIDDMNAGYRPLPKKPTRQIPPISAVAYNAIKRRC